MANTKTTLLTLLLVLSILASSGLAKSLEDHSITINIDKNGNALVLEKYLISLANSQEATEFDKTSQTSQTSIAEWQKFYNQIDSSVIGEKQDLLITGRRDSLGFGTVALEYEIKELAKKTGEEGRYSTFSINATQFDFYKPEIDLFILPSKTKIVFEISALSSSQLNEPEKHVETRPRSIFLGPLINLQENKVTLIGSGPTSTPEFLVSYKVEKSVGEVNPGKLLTSLAQFLAANPIYALLLILVLVTMVVYRRPLLTIIAESFAGEEEIHPPKKR